MKKTNNKTGFKAWLKSWDQGNFDFSMQTMEHGLAHERSSHEDKEWEKVTLPTLERREFAVFQKVYPVICVLMTLAMIGFLLFAVVNLPAFGSAEAPANSNQVPVRYVEQGMAETGAVNTVAGVILDYRAFDTLGESHVLFTAAMAVFILLLSDHERKESVRAREILVGDVVLRNTTRSLVALITIFGAYVVLNGHLGPGGGFSGGAIIGGGLILYTSAFGSERISQVLRFTVYKVTICCALVFYSLSKCYSFFCGANGLHSIFGPGTPGRIFSAGLILPLNIAVGIVVALTMYGFYSLFTRRSI